jgi:probable rRNA maturation factor
MPGTYQIAVSDQQSAVEISESVVERIIRETLTVEGVVEAEISVALVDDPTIHEVNRDHLDHDYPTDVISFLFEDEVLTEPGPRAPRGAGKRIEGEIIVSGDTAVREAARFGWSPENELTLYLVHGLLHLCGYDDLTDEEQLVMRERERTVLALWGLKPHYDA